IARKHLNKRFSEKTIADLELAMNQYLQEHRYLNARLEQKNAKYNSSKTTAELTYSVNDPYLFSLTLRGNNRYSRGDILRAIDLDNFDRTSLNPAAEISDRVKKMYLSEGFAHVRVRFSVKEQPASFIKEIIIDIQEGVRVKI